jgi:hypothetical protein
MNLGCPIESAERMFKQILEEIFIAYNDYKFHSSSGIEKHRRVWTYTNELLPYLAEQYINNLSHHPSKRIISSYPDDIRMPFDTGLKHREHCITH